jgi:hypothetical protein
MSMKHFLGIAHSSRKSCSEWKRITYGMILMMLRWHYRILSYILLIHTNLSCDYYERPIHRKVRGNESDNHLIRLASLCLNQENANAHFQENIRLSPSVNFESTKKVLYGSNTLI